MRFEGAFEYNIVYMNIAGEDDLHSTPCCATFLWENAVLHGLRQILIKRPDTGGRTAGSACYIAS